MLLLCALCGALSDPTLAQQNSDAGRPLGDRLINLDTPAMPPRGAVAFGGDLRVFGAQEDTTYGTLQLGYGLQDTVELLLRAGYAGTQEFAGSGFTIRHGGHDAELLAKLRTPQHPDWAVELGVSAPNTPAQNGTYLTTQFLYQRPLGSRATLVFVPKAVFVKDNPLIAIGGGASVRLGNTLQVIGDITGLVSGDNTRSIFSGDKQRGEVWGLALRFTSRSASHDVMVDLGVTNGIGGTTGFSLTPGLSGSAAVYLSILLRR